MSDYIMPDGSIKKNVPPHIIELVDGAQKKLDDAMHLDYQRVRATMLLGIVAKALALDTKSEYMQQARDLALRAEELEPKYEMAVQFLKEYAMVLKWVQMAHPNAPAIEIDTGVPGEGWGLGLIEARERLAKFMEGA